MLFNAVPKCLSGHTLATITGKQHPACTSLFKQSERGPLLIGKLATNAWATSPIGTSRSLDPLPKTLTTPAAQINLAD